MLVVTEPSYLALHAMEEMLDTVDAIAEDQSPALSLGGVILNRLDTTAEHRRSVEELEANFGRACGRRTSPSEPFLQDAMCQGIPPQNLTTQPPRRRNRGPSSISS